MIEKGKTERKEGRKIVTEEKQRKIIIKSEEGK